MVYCNSALVWLTACSENTAFSCFVPMFAYLWPIAGVDQTVQLGPPEGERIPYHMVPASNQGTAHLQLFSYFSG